MSPVEDDDLVISVDEDFGGDTKAHYLPAEPRQPAPAALPCRRLWGCLAPLNSAGLCTLHFKSQLEGDPPSVPELPPPPPGPSQPCPLCEFGVSITDLPEIAVWSCGHWIKKRSRSIAESFQDMLRSAYQAGVTAATNGETFESWYQREVLT